MTNCTPIIPASLKFCPRVQNLTPQLNSKFYIQKKKVATPNAQAIVELIQVDKNGQQSAAQEVDVLVIRENQQYYWEWNNGWHSNQNTLVKNGYTNSCIESHPQKR